MKHLRAAAGGAALMFWMGQAEAAKYPKPEDFKPVGVPVAAESGLAVDGSGPGGHLSDSGHGEFPDGGAGPGGHESGHADAHPGGGDAGGHADAHHGAHAFHHHHVALFGGATLHAKEADPTAGLDYEYRLGEHLGLLGLAEVVFAHEPVQIYGLGVAWHVNSPLRFALVPALEIAHGHMAFLMRGNAEYGFHVGSLSIAPSASLDYVSGHILPVIGIAVGSGF